MQSISVSFIALLKFRFNLRLSIFGSMSASCETFRFCMLSVRQTSLVWRHRFPPLTLLLSSARWNVRTVIKINNKKYSLKISSVKLQIVATKKVVARWCQINSKLEYFYRMVPSISRCQKMLLQMEKLSFSLALKIRRLLSKDFLSKQRPQVSANFNPFHYHTSCSKSS